MYNLWIYPQVIKHGHENNNHLVRWFSQHTALVNSQDWWDWSGFWNPWTSSCCSRKIQVLSGLDVQNYSPSKLWTSFEWFTTLVARDIVPFLTVKGLFTVGWMWAGSRLGSQWFRGLILISQIKMWWCFYDVFVLVFLAICHLGHCRLRIWKASRQNANGIEGKPLLETLDVGMGQYL